MNDYWEKNGIVKPQEIIVCAANRKGGVIFAGARHCDKVMHRQAKAAGTNLTVSEQGFINQFGEFRTREEALKIVLENGQPFNKKRNGSTTELFSEGLY
jgi:hypothetical protein